MVAMFPMVPSVQDWPFTSQLTATCGTVRFARGSDDARMNRDHSDSDNCVSQGISRLVTAAEKLSDRTNTAK